MTITKLECWNLALAQIGEKTLASTAPGSRLSDILASFWVGARQACMTASTWSFATKVATLVPTLVTPDDYAYEYEFPTDCLRIIELTANGYPNALVGPRSTYATRTRDGDLYIYSDVMTAKARYIFDAVDGTTDEPIGWSWPFGEFVAAKLAGRIAIPVAGIAGMSLRDAALRMEREATIAALSLDATTQRGEMPNQSRYIAARGYGV